MRLFTTATLVAVLLTFSGMALAQTPTAGQGQGQMGQGMMMQGMQCPCMAMMSQNPHIMEQMSQGKLSPEDQKKMADVMKSCPMMKQMQQQQKPEHPKK